MFSLIDLLKDCKIPLNLNNKLEIEKSEGIKLILSILLKKKNQNNFLNISIYNTTGIGKEHIIQKYSQNFAKWHIQPIAMRLDSMIPMLIEDVVVKFIKGKFCVYA